MGTVNFHTFGDGDYVSAPITAELIRYHGALGTYILQGYITADNLTPTPSDVFEKMKSVFPKLTQSTLTHFKIIMIYFYLKSVFEIHFNSES